MSEQWHRDYIELAFRLEKLFQSHIGLPYVDYYYGPSEWKTLVDNEPEQEPVVLLRAATRLLDALEEQGFAHHRTTYLSKQVSAMETACRKLSGEQFSLEEELRRLFDLTFVWTPSDQLDEALALYREALPGKGTLADRLHLWRVGHSIKASKRALIPDVIDRMLTEIRSRTLAFVDLPDTEGINSPVALAMDERFGGACWYEGNYHSHVEINIEEFILRRDHAQLLLDALCHEVYPGHHTAYALRERYLYREQGCREEMIGLIFSPAAVVAEGIATSACGMLFSPREGEDWLAEYIYPELGVEPDGADVAKIQRATDVLDSIGGNAIFLMREGQSEEALRDYLIPYMRQPNLQFWQRPFHEFFGIVESSGKRLLQPWLHGPDRQQTFRRFLVEQWYPAELVQRA
jgi:hypothetical protein